MNFPTEESSQPTGRRWLVVLAVLFLIAVGVWLRIRIARELPWDADESIAGLMARNIAFRGERPLFLYGENYVGAAMQYVVALLFKLWGYHPNLLRWPEYALTGVFLLLGFVLAKRHASCTAGLYTLLLLAVPPVFLTVMNLKAWGDYNETYCLGGILWYLSVILGKLDSRDVWRRFMLCLVWGGCFGLGVWIHFPIVIYAAATMPLALIGRRWWPSLVGISGVAIGFLVGWFPALWQNLSTGFANIGYATKGSGDYLTRLEQSGFQIQRLVERGLPFIYGVHSDTARFVEYRAFDPLFARLLVLGGIAFLLGWYLFRHDWRRHETTASWQDRYTPLVPVVMLLVWIAAVAYGRWGGQSFTPRYYSFAYLPVAVMLGCGIAAWSKRYLLPVWLWGIFVLYVNLYGHVTFINHPTERTAEDLVRFLEQERIEAVFTDYWLAHTVTFLTNEAIIGSVHGGPVRHERYPRYSEQAEAATRSAYALYRDYHHDLLTPIETGLEDLGVTYQTTDLGPLRIYYELSRPVRPGELDLYYAY